MSSFPEHEKNIDSIRDMKLDVDSVDLNDDPYESWDYDALTYLVTELIDIIKELKKPIK